jgi:hypothetical protein
VAAAGVPADTPNRAVWCLVAAMVAVRDEPAWARTLGRLAGHPHCEECDEVWPLADAVGDVPASEPVDADDAGPPTVADSAGFRPAPAAGGARLVPLEVRPRALAVAGDRLVVGHDGGLLALTLTG